ncbi:Ankyrin repeat and FYVE domain-containing protein 1, partial [Bulinus truncatus]
MATDEVLKLQNHLSLLREEYVKLQNRLADVERRYQVAVAAGGGNGEAQDGFVCRLLKLIADLFDKEQYSDLTIRLEGGHDVNAHKFILSARSSDWGVPDLQVISELDMKDIRHDVAYALIKWIYTDEINIQAQDSFLLELLRAATKYKLEELRNRCENGLMSFVNMKNCIRFYQTAEEMQAEVLKKHCSELISNHWNQFTSEDFASMPAPLLYKMFKAKTEYPLHTAIRAMREDVLFLYLIEFDSQLSVKVNEVDNKGDLALDLALKTHQRSIAQTLVSNKADVNRKDNSGKCLLYKAIQRGDEEAAEFLIKNGCDTNLATHLDKETPLHMVANFDPKITDPSVIKGMANVAKLLIENKADVNAQDSTGRQAENASDNNATVYDENCAAAQLIKAGASPDAVEPESGNTLLHLAAQHGYQAAGIFLTDHGANVGQPNFKGETPLHIACEEGLTDLVRKLLEHGSNPNAQTVKTPTTSVLGYEQTSHEISQQTPLHLALVKGHHSVVQVFLDYKKELSKSGNTSTKVLPNFNVKDSLGQTVLGLALWNNMHDMADKLLACGANINEKNSSGMTLLHQAIEKQDTGSALFLMDHLADLEAISPDEQSVIQHAISRHLPVVVEALCKRGVNKDITDAEGNCPLWQALDSGQEEIAHTLVKYGCDVNLWTQSPGGYFHTLLHRALDQNNESIACFLIRSGCDKNCPRRPGPNGEGAEEGNDGQSPLHMACAWGLEMVVQCLMEHNADVNAQDSEGKTPVHIAIENQFPVVISLLLSHPGLDLTARDKKNNTPFAAAMIKKDNRAAQAILNREPTAAEQVDSKGKNFLHTAIQKADIESVLFLLSVHANVNSRTQDSQNLTPLHLAVLTGSEIIVRNLLLAGAAVDERTKNCETALHLAATKDCYTIVSILLDNRADFDAVDENLNNALHRAVIHGNINTVRVLLMESTINAEAVNAKGQNALHLLGQYGKDNAAAIFELFKETMPEYPIDKPDNEGNTAILLAYLNGNGSLCRALVRAGACLGKVNKQGLSIFNAPVATKQLLVKLLDMLSKEPPWSDGETCLECMAKFNIKTRKHH